MINGLKRIEIQLTIDPWDQETAVEHQHRDCAAILLEHGANHDHRGVNGNTALHFAVRVSSKPLVELLLEYGADIDAKNKWGYTPLTLAITENREEMVKFLLQKGADVNAQDEVFSTADEKFGSSCYKTAPVIPLETAALAESCDAPKEEAAKKKDNGPAADQNKVSVCSIRVQSYKGKYKAEGAEKKEDKCSLCNPEHLSNLRDKAINPVQRPAGKHSRVGMHSLLEKRDKGVLQPAGAAAKKEDTDSPRDPETESEGEGKASAAAQLPAANSNRLDACSAAVESGKEVLKQTWREVKKEERVLQPAVGEAKQEYNDSPWDSELKDLKEPLNKNEYYADSGKNAQKEKVITILRNMQGILVDSFDSSAATIALLEERIQRLQMQTARLEATIQQQAKTIEVFETIQQSLTSVSYSEPSLFMTHRA
ncbi:hypothetical protein EK904_014895 [Melospiza melodia maxima]|nr:hypothetical protein EK904_014895 [Melospiza melodia maxima]